MSQILTRKRLAQVLTLLLVPALLAACGGQPSPAPPTDTAPPVDTASPADSADQAQGAERIDTSRYPIFYGLFWQMSDEGPLIPALDEGYVPQGLAYWPGQDGLVISYYHESAASILVVVDGTSGQPSKRVSLAEPDGSRYTGHAGGVAVSEKHLWVSSGGQLYWIELDALAAAEDGAQVRFGGAVPTVARASFTTYEDGILWVGEYHLLPDYETDRSHDLKSPDGSRYSAWAAGYRLDAQDRIPHEGEGPAIPDYVLSIPDKVQGMTFTPDEVILSQSYGRSNDSTLTRHRRPDLTGQPQETVTVGGREVPVWFLDSGTLAANLPALPAPPMSEGVDTDGADRLFVLFESGATRYREGSSAPMDHVRVLGLSEWERAEE